MCKKVILILIVFITSQHICNSQQEYKLISDKAELLEYAEDVCGSDDRLINGRIYVPLHSLAEGHPYFGSKDWVSGTIYIKGKRYDEVQIKYDIELDEIVLFIEDNYKRKNYIVLNRHYVDSVQIGNYQFINTIVVPQVDKKIGYAESVYNSGFLFLVKYEKSFILSSFFSVTSSSR